MIKYQFDVQWGMLILEKQTLQHLENELTK
jgi:hypothetical protein